MLEFCKAATVAAVSVTLGSAVFTAVPSFAFGNSQSTALSVDTVTFDPSLVAADQSTMKLAAQSEVTTKLADNGDIIFIPGNGGGPMMDPADKKPADTDQGPDKLSASTLAEMVRMQDTKASLDTEQRCLAAAVYFESKGESLSGQLAVARVVMARSKSGRFPTSLCGVVYQKSQFSFVRGNSIPRIYTGGTHWRHAVAVSKIALSNGWKSPVEGALFFHARSVSPGWRMTRLGTVDNHVFYR